MNKPLFLTAVAFVFFGCIFSSQAETVLWRHAADTLDGVRPGPCVILHEEQSAPLVEQGSGSIRAVFSREQALKRPPQWNGFFQVHWNLPRVEIRKGDTLKLSYRMNRIEAFYPSLSLKLVDEDGQSWHYQWNKGEKQAKLATAGQWLDVEIDLFAERRGGPNRLGRIVRLSAVANNSAFRSLSDYVRWFDDLRIVRPSAARPAKGGGKEQAPLTIRHTTDRFPVYFASRMEHVNADGVPSEWDGILSVDAASGRFIPHSRYNSWSGPEDHGPSFRMGWNEDGLFFSTEVRDDSVKVEHVDKVDFKDSDHVRLYFDFGRESQTRAVEFDTNDYIFAAVPFSPAGPPMIRRVQWDFHETAPLAMEPDRFPIGGTASSDRWNMEIVFPPAAFPDWTPRANQTVVFAAGWGDTDTSIRDNEMFWPDVRGPDNYWRKYSLYADVVLMSEQAGFAARSLHTKAYEGQAWEFLLAARLAETPQGPQRYLLRVRAHADDGAVAGEWSAPLLMTPETEFHRIRVAPDALEAGSYTLRFSLESGQAVLVGDSWPVQRMKGRLEEIRAAFNRRIHSLAVFRDEVNRIVESGSAHAAYLRPDTAVMDFFLPMVRNALHDNNYLEAERLLKNLERVRAEAGDDPRPFSVPAAIRPDGNPVTIEGSALIHNGTRIFLPGFTSAFRWFPETTVDLGFNAFHSNHPMRQTTPEPGGPVPPDVVEEIHERYETFRKLGIFGGVIGLVAGSPPVQWMVDNERIARAGGHFIPYCIEEPLSIRYMEAHYRELMGVLSDVDNIVVHLLLNEPTYEGRTPEFERMFQDWLAAQYESIGALNAAWETAYGSFRDVPADKLTPSERGRYDWTVFNQKHLTEHVRQLHGWAKQYDRRQRPTHVKVTSQPLRTPNAWATGVDWEQISLITDMVGYDSPDKDEPMMTDFMRSLASGKPLVNSEVHMEWFPESAPWLNHWRMAARGCDIMLNWQWKQPGQLKGRTGYPTQEPYGLWRTGREALDLQRVADPLLALSETPAEIAILHTLPALTFEPQRLFLRMREVYDSLQYIGAPVRFLTHQQMAREGVPDGIRLVVAAGIQHMLDSSRDALNAFTERGGLILAVDSPMDRDINGRVAAPLRTAPERVFTAEPTAAVWKDPASRYQYLNDIVERADVHRPVRIVTGHGSPQYGIDYWVSANGRWMFIAPVEIEGDTVDIMFSASDQEGRNGVDLVRNDPIPLSGPVSLERHRAYVIDREPASARD